MLAAATAAVCFATIALLVGGPRPPTQPGRRPGYFPYPPAQRTCCVDADGTVAPCQI